MLTISILLYPLLTYLATPLVQSHAEGQRVVVCTLQGEQAVLIDFESSSGSVPETCPALKLLQLLTTADKAVPPSVPTQILHALIPSPVFVPYPYSAPHAQAYSSRAPPFV